MSAVRRAVLSVMVMTVAGDREAPAVNAALGVTAGKDRHGFEATATRYRRRIK